MMKEKKVEGADLKQKLFDHSRKNNL